ncbi:hypothetical protein [Agrococcus sp. Ld7]|uniref:hypothetical protein n=1 Tax=Agrococcus sp. Ld7 TaxID=649148 RepID=UPI00386FC93A
MVSNVLRVFARRWYVVLLGVLLTAGLAYGAALAAPSEFRSRALILLLPSQEAVGEDGNPFLALDGLEQPASLVAAYFSSAAAQEEVAAQSETATFSVDLDAQVRGPVILIQVTDETEAQSLATLGYLRDRVPEELRRLQEGVGAPASSFITSMVLTSDAEATRDNGAAVRLIIAVLVLGAIGTGFLTFVVDGSLARRASRRAAGGRDSEPDALRATTQAPGDERADQLAEEDSLPHPRTPSHRAERTRPQNRARSR